MKPSESGAPELGEAVPMQHAPPDMTCDSAACSDPKLDNYNNYNYRVSTLRSLKPFIIFAPVCMLVLVLV